MVKVISQVGIEGTYFNVIKAMYDKPTASNILNRQKLTNVSLKTQNKTGMFTFTSLINIVLEILATAIK